MKKLLIQFVVLAILGALSLAGFSLVSAQTVDELQAKIAAKNQEIQQLETEIAQYQGNLADLATKKTTLANSIIQLNVLQKKLDTDIKVTQAQVDSTDLKIQQTGSQISYKENQIDIHTAALREALENIYESDAYSLPQIALSSDSFSGMWDDIQQLGNFTDVINTTVDELKSLKDDLQAKKDTQEAQKKQQLSLKSKLSDQRQIAVDTKNQQNKLLTQTKNQESEYQKLLNQKIALKAAVEQEVRDYESTLKFILDPSSFPPRGTKVFSPPVTPLIITQQFGKTSSSGRLYASGTHNGTDFKASVGTPVQAMLSGTVIGTGDTDLTCPGASYGRWVLIKHNDGLASLYAHFSLVKVSRGQTVSTGDVIGYSGNTGYTTGPHLHVSVFVAAAVSVQDLPSKSCGGRIYTMPVAAFNAYLDPMDYL